MSTSFDSIGQSIQGLAQAITVRYDSNQDGQLSAGEFSSFLEGFLGRLQKESPTTAAEGLITASPSAERPIVGTMAGFDSRKMGDLSHQTFKYRIGRILQHYPNTPAGLREALPEIQQLVPNAAMVGRDKIDFGDYVDPKAGRIGTIDVIQASGLGGVAWQWLPVE